MFSVTLSVFLLREKCIEMSIEGWLTNFAPLLPKVSIQFCYAKSLSLTRGISFFCQVEWIFPQKNLYRNLYRKQVNLFTIFFFILFSFVQVFDTILFHKITQPDKRHFVFLSGWVNFSLEKFVSKPRQKEGYSFGITFLE